MVSELPEFINREEAFEFVANHIFPVGSDTPLSELYPNYSEYMAMIEQVDAETLIERFQFQALQVTPGDLMKDFEPGSLEFNMAGVDESQVADWFTQHPIEEGSATPNILHSDDVVTA